jgi:hypothetical protein
MSSRPQSHGLQASSRHEIPRRFRLGLLTGLCLAGPLLSPAAFAADPGPEPNVRIFVTNYAKLSPEVVQAAEREAGRILSKAGVIPLWQDCALGDSPDASEHRCEATHSRKRFSCEFLALQPKTNSTTQYSVSPRRPYSPAPTPNSRCDVPPGTTPPSRRPSFWEASWPTKLGIFCWARTVTPAQASCSPVGRRDNSTS